MSRGAGCQNKALERKARPEGCAQVLIFESYDTLGNYPAEGNGGGLITVRCPENHGCRPKRR
ncbi:MAG: hypothetical protein B6D68_00360 [spirochete symbiont of Stewartia floridana]|nr:MAG: hypothetical protein B6D68_00360 [spirochete symbiont of Stewartia floridana]